MDQHRPSFPNPGNSRFPPFYHAPNPHHNHHQHHLPPAPSLPPPPPRPPHQSPISFPPLPPPPNSFHHHHGHSSHQFVNPPHRVRHQQPLDPNLINHDRNHNHNLINRRVDFAQAPRRASERLVLVDRRRGRPFPLYRGHDGDPGGPAVWEPSPRVPIDATPPPPPLPPPITRRIPRVCFDREHSPYRPTFQPVDRFRNDQDGGSRVRKGGNSDFWLRVDDLPRERRDDFLRNYNIHHDRFQRDDDRDIHRKEFVSATGEQFSRLVPQEELIMQGRGHVVDGNLMWENLPRGAPHSPTEIRNRAIDGGNGFYEKGKNHVQESERYGDRDRWEDAQDYNITPRKKQKKKNVLLRIQPAIPSYNDSYEHSPSVCNDREPSQFPDHRLNNKQRERSPIVSFKSNLLIVASSSSGAVADDVSAYRDDKNRNELDNKGALLLPSDVVEKVSSKKDSDNECENGPFTFRKEEMHLEKKPESPTLLTKVKSFVSHHLPVGNSEAPCRRTECLSEDKKPSKSPNGKVLDKSYAASGSGKECSPSFRKKRKITNPYSSPSSSQVLRKNLESISVDNLVNSLSSESMFDEGLKDTGRDLTADVYVTESTEITSTASHMKSTAVVSSKAVDGKCADDFVSAGASVFGEGLKDSGKDLTADVNVTAVGSSKAVDGKCADDFVSAGASVFGEGLKDSGKDLTTDVNVTESTEIALTASHMKSTAVGSSKAVDEKCADDFVSAGASVFDEGLKDSGKDLIADVNVTESTEIALTASHMKSTAVGSSKAVDGKHVVDSLSAGASVFDKGLKNSGKDLTADVNITESTEIALNASHMKSTAVGSSKAVDGKCADDSVPAGASVPKKKRKRIRKRRRCSSGQLSGKPDEIQVDGIASTQDVQRPSNLEGCTNVLSAADSMNGLERQLNISRVGGADPASGSGDASDIVKETSQNQTSASLEEGEIDESMDANPSEQDNKSTQVSVLEELCISDVSRCKVAITRAVDNVVPQNSGQSINGSDANAVNDAADPSCTGKLSRSIDVGVSGGFPESEILEGDLSLFPAEGSLTKHDRKRKISDLHRGTRKIDAFSLTLGCSIDSDLAQDKVAGSGVACPDAQLELQIGDCLTTNGSEGRISSQEAAVSVNPYVNAFPSEVVTSTCDKKNKVIAPELGSAHGTPTEICKNVASSDSLPCDAEVPGCSVQVAPISSVDVGLSVSEFASQSDLAHSRKGLDLNCCDDASAQISAGIKLVEEKCGKGCSNFVLPGTANVSGIPNEKHTSTLSQSVRRPQGDGTLLMNGSIDSYCGFGIKSGRSICDTNAVGDCSSQNLCSDQNTDHPETPIVNGDHEPLVRDKECDINVPVKSDISSQAEHLTLFSQSTSDHRVTNCSPTTDILSLVDYPENISATSSMEMFDVPKINGNPDGKTCSAQRKSSGKPGFLSSFSISAPNHIVNSKMASVTDGIATSSGKNMPFIRASRTSKDLLQSSSNDRKKQTRIKNEVKLASSSKALSSHSSFVPSSGRRPTTVVKSRTWHRIDNPTSVSNLPGQNSSTIFVPQQKQTFDQTVRTQSNSYVRKGNSLLRNPVTAVSQTPKTSVPATSVPQLNLFTSEDATPCEVPVNLSSTCNIDSSNCNLAPPGDPRCSPVADSSMATDNGPEGFPEDMPKSSGNSEFETSKSLEDQGSLNHSNQATLSSRRMVYIKRKSYQLVAAPNSSSEISASNKDIPALMSDVYYKSTKNQLVRANPDTNSRQTIVDPIDEGRRVFKSYVSRSATKRDSNRVSQKIPKSRKSSLVWKLCNSWSPKKGVNSLRCQQVLPHLLPWKRATYRRSLFRTSADLLKNSPLSHKLLSSKKMHIIYKRSGFSLRRSKVVSLAGSSLKWSISLERRSKKVDKEATSAVAALKKEKREKSNASIISSGIESKHNSLHEEHSRSGTGHHVKNALKPSIPRRLHIRNDEYVRIGNGNQLIRNPKRRTRILASEKVRWSLHTARMRLAKKRKYCQFFTRFGKCNKEEGKCPYIHDPSKTAVCTKFLNGLCSDPKCKLTHKVIPERMPDCSFFLHGLCSNESCPYRHVSVNPKAAICESFLKGYCAEGNECRKKHSYICPLYEAAGECPEGSKCKLYHRKKGKDKKRKNAKDQKNARGRYFGSRRAAGSNEAETEASRKRLEPKDDGIVLEDGALADYISLDVSEDEEGGEQEDEASQETNPSWGEQPSLVLDDPDVLIKPIRLLRMMSLNA